MSFAIGMVVGSILGGIAGLFSGWCVCIWAVKNAYTRSDKRGR